MTGRATNQDKEGKYVQKKSGHNVLKYVKNGEEVAGVDKK